MTTPTRPSTPLTAAECSAIAALDEAALIALRDDPTSSLPTKAACVTALVTLARQARGDTGFAVCAFSDPGPDMRSRLEALADVLFADAMTPAAAPVTMPRIERAAAEAVTA